MIELQWTHMIHDWLGEEKKNKNSMLLYLLPWSQRWRGRHTGTWRWYWSHFIFEIWKCFNDQISKLQQRADFIL